MARPARALERLERILVMVPWLLRHPGVPLDDVAERFGVSPRDVADDLDILGYCGVPGYGGGDLIEVSVAGDRVVVRMADYFRRPLGLSLQEALTLLLAARALAGVQALDESAPLRRAADKLQAAMAQAGAAAVQLTVDLTAPGDEHLATVRAAAEDGQVLRLVYRSAKGETTTRDVEPHAVVGWSGSWYLHGWCRLARDVRDFRLDRIQRLQVTDARMAAPARREVAAPAYEPSADDVEVVLEVAPEAWWVADWAVVDEVSDHGAMRRIRLRTSDPEWVARLALRLAGSVTVVGPSEVVARVRALANATLDLYRREHPDRTSA